LLLLATITLVVNPALAEKSVAGGIGWYMLAEPDQSDWSDKRRTGYARAMDLAADTPEAVLEIPDLQLAVPVYGNSERTALELGAGWIPGTAEPGEQGNVAIAGHRDGFFRPLERVSTGQQLVLVTPERSLRYVIEQISIVDPLDVSVLEPTEKSVLTLITCYPFRYVGYAPDRYIVRARLIDE
jgi:sortase A